MTTTNLPADWALEEALKRCGCGLGIGWFKACDGGDYWGYHAIIELARMIEAHEQEPVDPLYEALRAVVEMGRYDTREQTELLRRELAARGLEIVEVRP